MTPVERERLIHDAARHVAELNGHSEDWDRFIEEAQDYLGFYETEIKKQCAEIAGQRSIMLPHDSDFTRGYACGRGDAYHAILASIPEK